MIKEQMILENINLIYQVLKKMGLYSKLDEWYDVGVIGLIKGVNGYDPDKGYKLSTFLCSCIKNEILIELRRMNSDKRKANYGCISLDKEIYSNEHGESLLLSDTLQQDYNLEDEVIKKDILNDVLNNLSEREKGILISLHGLFGKEELTQKQIASKMNLSQAQVSRIYKSAIEKIRSEKL